MLSQPLMTLHEVAELLKVKESTVRTWIRDKSLRAIKFGKDWRVAQTDLELFVEAHANRPAAVAEPSVARAGYAGEPRPKDRNGAGTHR